VARDYAKKRGTGSGKGSARKKQSAGGKPAPGHYPNPGHGMRWYLAGVLTGIFLSFLLYLGTLPPTTAPVTGPAAGQPETAEQVPPKPRFDFYTMLPEQTIEEDVVAAEPIQPAAATAPAAYYMLQAGSFRQREDADRRRAELLLLGLEPRIEESNSDNGRWFRVYLGPFDSRGKMARARSLTAAQNIDTLVLKRNG